MENNVHSDELQHHGTKGMRWGIRRYQNKDGSLTPAGQKRYNKEVEKLKAETAKVKAAEKVAANRAKTQSKLDKLEAKKQELEERKKALKGKSDNDADKAPEETVEQRRERVLKSTNPKEIYENRDVLSYQELNDRVNRIDLEARLQSKIPVEKQKTGMDYMDSAKNSIDKATNLFRSVDNAYSAVANSAIGKTLAKQLGIETPKKEFDINEFWKNRHKKSAQEMMEANKWLTAEEQISKKTGLSTDGVAGAKKPNSKSNDESGSKKSSDEAAKKEASEKKAADKAAKQAEKEAAKAEKKAAKENAEHVKSSKTRNAEVEDLVRKANSELSKAADISDEYVNNISVNDSFVQDILSRNADKLK